MAEPAADAVGGDRDQGEGQTPQCDLWKASRSSNQPWLMASSSRRRRDRWVWPRCRSGCHRRRLPPGWCRRRVRQPLAGRPRPWCHHPWVCLSGVCTGVIGGRFVGRNVDGRLVGDEHRVVAGDRFGVFLGLEFVRRAGDPTFDDLAGLSKLWTTMRSRAVYFGWHDVSVNSALVGSLVVTTQ